MSSLANAVFRRILFVLDPTTSAGVGLDAAVALAGRLHADLEGLFLEDIDVLRSAQLPFVRELNRLTGVPMALEPETVERDLRARARAARTRLAGAAQALRVNTSLRVVRGKRDAEIRLAARHCDLLIFERHRLWPAQLHLDAPLLIAKELNLPVCVLGLTPEIGEQVRVLYDGSEGADRALHFAISLARISGATLEVALPFADRERQDVFEQRVLEQAKDAGIAARVYKSSGSFDPLKSWMRQTTQGTFVINLESPLLAREKLRDFMAHLDGPVLLV